MKWIWIGCILLLLLLVLILLSKIKVSIYYSHAQDDDSLQVDFRALFGLIKYRLNVPLVKVDEDSSTLVIDKKLESEGGKIKNKSITQISGEDMLKNFQDFRTLLRHIVSFHRIIRHFFKKVKVTELDWRTNIGAGDAALTGILTGALWTIKGSLIGLISEYFLLQNIPRITVQPHFQMKVTQTIFKCMLQFRIGHAMLAGIKIVKFWKGGWPKLHKKPFSALSQDKTNSIS
nr:DUF2953 domain-containing protein [uncultured Bacillus sp.]